MSHPSLSETFGQVIRLRFNLFLRRMTGRGFLATLISVTIALALSGGLGAGSFLLFSAVPGIYGNPIWMAFILSLFCFLLSLFWVIWPVIAAQIDEAYELSRFFSYPVRPGRLYLIQSTAGLLEPAVLFFYPALLGAGLGLTHTLGPGGPATLGLMLCFTLMNVAAGRCIQNLFLNVMKSRRSVEILFAGFLVFLGLSAFIPPVDASWLFERFGGFSTEPEDLAVLARTTRALGTTPPGWLAVGLKAAAAGRTWIAVGAAGLMLVVAALAWILGLLLLKRFYRGGRGIRLLPSPKPQVTRSPGWRLPGASDSTSAAFEKECRVLFANPKARLLFAVPFFLLILLKLIGAPQLFSYLWSDAWAAMLLSLLGLYILSVLSGQFFGNGFGYDGSAVLQTYLSPAPLRSWLAGRNLAQGLFAAAQFLGLTCLLYLLVPDAGLRGIAVPVCCFPFGLLVMLAVGNLLSARFPRRFHDTLARRDRPVGASFVFVIAVLGTCTLLALLPISLAAGRESLLWLALAPLPLIGALLYRLLFPLALGWTRRYRERIISEIARPV